MCYVLCVMFFFFSFFFLSFFDVQLLPGIDFQWEEGIYQGMHANRQNVPFVGSETSRKGIERTKRHNKTHQSFFLSCFSSFYFFSFSLVLHPSTFPQPPFPSFLVSSNSIVAHCLISLSVTLFQVSFAHVDCNSPFLVSTLWTQKQ